ncbi:uncharacterized protein BP5553_04075 [Venustampulla echinocandica]|uniref:Uncharacterized protein n=1 Tax=Venustampulla echinocandica TaxID=2656787 RepID=A0A370TW35_9HELO|nr:uncharacterized protein BP5553_04075 [Venustampulla echinocandica]RDL39735.1 hypothetical protein BP5553_04075 [Venustampulla echinocandica]
MNVIAEHIVPIAASEPPTPIPIFDPLLSAEDEGDGISLGDLVSVFVASAEPLVGEVPGEVVEGDADAGPVAALNTKPLIFADHSLANTQRGVTLSKCGSTQKGAQKSV